MAAPQNFVSVSRRPPDVEDYIDILRRYSSWVIAPTFAGLVISVVVAYWMPNVYVCTAKMQIKPSSIVMEGISRGRSMEQRVQSLRLEIMSRDNLISLMTLPNLNLYPKERARYSVEDVVEQYFQKNVAIVPLSDSSGSGAQAFQISFRYPDPLKAQRVVAELVSEVQNKEIQLQNNQTISASGLMESLVETAKERMDKANNEIAAFTAENQGKLPDNFQANMIDVENKNSEIVTLNDQIATERQHQALLDSQLSNNKNTQSSVQANLKTVVTQGNAVVKDTKLINLEQMIANKNSECAGLLRTYKEDFPDVLKCRDQKRALEDQRDTIEREGSGTSGGGSTVREVVNPQAQNELEKLKNDERDLRAQIDASVLAVNNKIRRIDVVSKELKAAQDKVAASPMVIQRFQELRQAVQMASEEYEKQSKNQNAARNEKTMEDRRAGETLETLEQPIKPELPASPVRGAIVGIGTMIGMVVGFALAGAKEIKNTSLKNLKDVRAYTNLPVLSSIPLLENALLVRRKRRLAWVAWSSAVIIGGGAMCAAVYYHLVMAGQVS